MPSGEHLREPAHPDTCRGKAKRFQARGNSGEGECLYCFPFGRKADSLRVLPVNVLTSGWLKLLNQTHLARMIWHFLSV